VSVRQIIFPALRVSATSLGCSRTGLSRMARGRPVTRTLEIWGPREVGTEDVVRSSLRSPTVFGEGEPYRALGKDPLPRI
jgi:hypothetical protein